MGDDPFKFPTDDGDREAIPGGGQGPAWTALAGGRGASAVRRLLAGNGLLVGLFAAGVACLYGMSLMKGPSAASAQQIQEQSSVDDALARLNIPAGAGGGKTTAAIVETFYCEARLRQIPASSLKGNPFLFKAIPPPPAATRPAEEPAAGPRPAESDGIAVAMAAARRLRLQSVLTGAREPAAMISDNLLTEGQTIHGWTVTKILPREVHLSWKDRNYVLSMPE